MNRPPDQRAASLLFRIAPLLTALACLTVGEAQALGFGRLPSQATLGQPLSLTIPIRLEDGEVLGAECATADVHFGDSRQQPGVVKLTLDPALPGASERQLRLLTSTRVDEPFVTVDLTLGCQAKVTRSFTLFADPPSFSATLPGAVGSDGPTDGRAATSATARLKVVPSPTAGDDELLPARQPTARRTARTRAGDEPQAGSPAGGLPSRLPESAAASPRVRSQAVAPSGPRLSLTPIERAPVAASRLAPDAALMATAAAAEAAAIATAAASAAEQQAAQDRARVAQLEASLQRLRAETSQAQATMRGLQAQVQAAEAARFANPLVFALLFLLGTLLLGFVWLWRLRAQDREAAAWLGDATRERSTVIDTAEAIAFGPASMPDAAPEMAPTAPPPLATPQAPISRSGAFDIEATQVLPGPPPAMAALQAIEPARRAVSAEELIDLEQQAEFFIVLGQEEAAIDLLMGHLRSTSGNSPLPYLKLLELYRKRGNRREYERVRERFNARFSAYAPAWELDLNDGRTLEDYPSVLGRLQALWPTPSRALEVLQLTLARPEADANAEPGADPNADASFELPAYRELMLLYSVARELTESEPIDTRSGVDLLLPLDGDLEPMRLEWQAPVLERLTATAAVTAQPDARQALHVDLPLDLPSPTAAEAAAAPVGFRSTTIEESGDDGLPSEAGRRP